MNKENKFSPLIFLASLGAGGISVIPFSFFQYTLHSGKGLITWAQVGHGSHSFGKELLFYGMEGIMIIFALAHVVLTIILAKGFIVWLKTKNYSEFLHDPLKNSGMLAPFISIAMTMNVFIGPIRFFVPPFAENLQSFMLPALIAWSVIWALLLRMELKLLKISFEKSFDVSKIHFGWLLHPFALGMVTVTGTGIAAMSHNPSVAHAAAFMSIISGSMGVFLLTVKLISLFKSHFAAPGLPEKQFLPSFLIVIPNITLYAISMFRLGHYLHNHFDAHLNLYYMIVIVVAFAFETWYFIFGLSLLKDYFKKYFFKKEFYISQWGLVCPFVAYAVLGSFFYKLFAPNVVTYSTILAFILGSIVLFFMILRKQLGCAGLLFKKNLECSHEQPVIVNA